MLGLESGSRFQLPTKGGIIPLVGIGMGDHSHATDVRLFPRQLKKKMNIKSVLRGITQNSYIGVPRSIREMNRKVLTSHRASPWHGNFTGNPCSDGIVKWQVDMYGEWEGWDLCDDDDLI